MSLPFDLFEDQRRARAQARLLAARTRGIVGGVISGLLLFACCAVIAATYYGFFSP
jgi:hypothetical protein